MEKRILTLEIECNEILLNEFRNWMEIVYPDASKNASDAYFAEFLGNSSGFAVAQSGNAFVWSDYENVEDE